MSKFIVLKLKDIIIFFTIIFFLSITLFIFFKLSTESDYTKSTIVLLDNSGIKKDLDCDGTIDTLIMEENSNCFLFKINTSNKSYTLVNNLNNKFLFDISTSYSPQLMTFDLTRDNHDEIILTGLKENVPITYVFKWNGSTFENILTLNKNIVGLLNSKNSRTPYLITTLSSKGDNATDGYLINGNSIKDINFSSPKIPSLSLIQTFIDLIQLTYEVDETPDIFSPSIPSEELAILWGLEKSSYRYNYQYGIFRDTQWNNDGMPSTLLWTLSFEKVNYSSHSIPSENLTLFIRVVLTPSGEYKISSIKK